MPPKSGPYPVIQENTLVLSNFLVVGKRNGKLSLMFRSVTVFPARRFCFVYMRACTRLLNVRCQIELTDSSYLSHSPRHSVFLWSLAAVHLS